MTKNEMSRFLRENGFVLERNGKHALWTNGHRRITLPHGSKLERRLCKMIMIQVRKAHDCHRGK